MDINGGPAFPFVLQGDGGPDGLSKREFFAAAALPALLANAMVVRDIPMSLREGLTLGDVAEKAYVMADQMLRFADALPHAIASLRAQVAELERMQPVWASTPTAIVGAAALAELWHMLNAKNQTEAVEKLSKLIDDMPS